MDTIQNLVGGFSISDQKPNQGLGFWESTLLLHKKATIQNSINYIHLSRCVIRMLGLLLLG